MARTSKQIKDEETAEQQKNSIVDQKQLKQNEIRQSFSERLSVAREKKGITHNRVAKDLGFQSNAIKQYENGNVEPSLSAARIFAEYYEVSLDWLCGEGPLMPKSERQVNIPIPEALAAIIDKYQPDIKYNEKSPDVTFSFKFSLHYMDNRFEFRDFIKAYLSLEKMVEELDGSPEEFEKLYLKLFKKYENKL